MDESNNSIPEHLKGTDCIGGFENLSSEHRSSRVAIKEELAGKLVFDDDGVFRRLKINEVDGNLIERCFNSFNTDNATAIAALKSLEGETAGLSEDELEKQSAAKKGREKDMYPHLRILFKYIESMEAGGTPFNGPRRAFVNSDTQKLVSDSSFTPGFPNVAPDFTLLGSSDLETEKWSDKDGFCEVKPSKKQTPKPARDQDVVKNLVSQSADYARLHMSARPFALFSVCLLIFGSDFCVAIFDRGGATLSPIKNLWVDTKVFIRIVYSMTRVLSATELGQDPSVSMLSPAVSNAVSPEGYPSFRVSAIGDDPREWCTVGAPMWSSISLLGRGTVVWLVCEYQVGSGPNPNVQKVMKTAWRDQKRHSETTIYLTVDFRKGRPKGLAEFLTGGDVQTPTGNTVTVALLRGTLDEKTPVLHRVILNTVGRPLWTYTSDLELLKGMHAAGSAHKFLSDQDIIHRDISAGNILLAKDPGSGGAAGFLTDLEFAQLGPVPSTKETTTVPPIEKAPGVWTEETQSTHLVFVSDKRGATLTGTLQFMAYDLLVAIRDRVSVQQTAEHDIQSFAHALGYTVLRKLLMDAKVRGDREMLNKYFRKAFGHTSLETIISSRYSGDTLGWVGEARLAHIVKKELSPILINLLAFFNHSVQTQIILKEWKKRKADFNFTVFQPEDPTSEYSDVSRGKTTLTHEFLLNSLSTAIKELETGAM